MSLFASTLSLQTLPAAEDFRPFTEVILGAEKNEVTRYVLLVHGKRYFLIPPPHWSVKADRAKRTITLLPQDFKAGITVKFALEPDGVAPELKRDELRERILERYPGAKFASEFECATGGQAGLVFDLERIVERATRTATRIAFVPCDGGLVEFELTAAADKLEDYRVAFGRLLNSFSIDGVARGKNGELVTSPNAAEQRSD